MVGTDTPGHPDPTGRAVHSGFPAVTWRTWERLPCWAGEGRAGLPRTCLLLRNGFSLNLNCSPPQVDGGKTAELPGKQAQLHLPASLSPEPQGRGALPGVPQLSGLGDRSGGRRRVGAHLATQGLDLSWGRAGGRASVSAGRFRDSAQQS